MTSRERVKRAIRLLQPRTDLREMLRAHIVSCGLACMATAIPALDYLHHFRDGEGQPAAGNELRAWQAPLNKSNGIMK